MKKLILTGLFAALIITPFFGQETSGNNNPPTAEASPCIPNAMPWHLGGDNIIASNSPSICATCPPGFYNDAGTCNNYAFILKANNFQSVFITPGGQIGVNQPVPTAALEVRHPVPAQQSSFKIYGDTDGNLESSTKINLNYATGSNFYINEGAAGTAVNHLEIAPGGNMGMGLMYANTKLTINANTQPGNTTGICIVGGASVINAIDVRGQGSYLSHFRVKSNGYVYAREINVMPYYITFPDYVFEKNYALKSIGELEKYIKVNKHLPNIPTAAEVAVNGINLAEMQVKQMEKMEEAFLYIIELKKENEALKKRIEKLEK